MDRVRTVATFIAGVLVGGSAVYFSPPSGGSAGGAPTNMSGPVMPPLPEGQGLAPGAQPMPGMAQPGTDGVVGQPGTPGAIPGTPGVIPPGTAGAPGTTMGAGEVPGTIPGSPGATPPQLPADLPPADGAGKPPEEVPAGPASATQVSGSRLEKHLRIASAVWSAQAELAKASSKDAIRTLAGDIAAHSENVPAIGEHMPPMQEVAGYLASSRVLLDRMQAAGMDVADLSLQVDMMMRPPKGKIPGGPKGSAAPQ